MVDTVPMFGFPVAGWHRYFAWHPVDTYDQGWKWLRFVYHRRIQKHWYLDGGASSWWEYSARAQSEDASRKMGE